MAIQALREGKVIAHPTETCYGLAVSILSQAAVERLYSIKKMPSDKPVSLLVAHLEQAKRYGSFSEKALILAQKYWPGPLTLIVPRTPELPQWINPGNDWVGMRISSHPLAQALVEGVGNPITTTSANLSGDREAYSVQEIEATGLSLDFILDGGTLPSVKPSTLVKVEEENLIVLRQGEIHI